MIPGWKMALILLFTALMVAGCVRSSLWMFITGALLLYLCHILFRDDSDGGG